MRSTNSSFDEEGEIFESDVEKAPPSLPSVSGPSVDRPSSRIPRASVSPARSSSPRHNDRFERDHRRPNNTDYQPRGEKRRRSREDDVRSHRVHYEAGGRDMPIRRPRVSYADIDRPDPRDSPRNNISPDFRRDAKRSRSRTRSRTRSPAPPPRGARLDQSRRGGGRDYYDDRRYDPRDNRNGCRYSGRSRSKDRPANERGDDPHRFERARRDAEARSEGSDRHADGASARRQFGNERCASDTYPELPARQLTLSRASNTSKKPNEPVLEIEEPIDEAKLIEERRKKREAIKAKYRGQATPLLATALGVKDKDTPAASPAEISDVNSPSRSPPLGPFKCSTNGLKVTPRSPRELTPGAVFALAKEGPAPDKVAGDEPSAADYDPTADMQEDQKRNEQRLHKNEVSSGAYNEMTSTDRDVLMREAGGPQAESNEQPKEDGDDDFDMFAEGEDDDMFAPPAPASKTEAGATAKAVPIIEAKQLDASLLDNWDDQEGYYKMIPGELLDNRYKVQMSLGKGMFSGVVRALDMTTNKDSAIKIIRNNETM